MAGSIKLRGSKYLEKDGPKSKQQGGTAPKAETGVQTGTGRARGFSGNAAMPGDDVVDSATGEKEADPSTARGLATGSKTKVGMTGGNQDSTRQSASNRTQAQGTGAAGDLRLKSGEKAPKTLGGKVKDLVKK